MSACSDVRNWITENVRQPVGSFFDTAEEKCHEARRWVEREVRTPVEARRTETQRKCRRRKCRKLCLCCNKWFCWIESVVLVVVEWVIKIVGEWLVETVCEVVVKSVGIPVRAAVAAGGFLVVAPTCLFTDPRSVVDAVADLWYDAVSTFEEAAGLISGALADISDFIDITRETLLNLGDALGPVGRFIFGMAAGILDAVRRVVEGIAQVFDGVVDVIAGILTLDLCRALNNGIVRGIFFGALKTLFGVTNSVFLGGGGVRDGFDRDALRQFIQDQLRLYTSDEEKVAEIEERLRMDSGLFGTAWPVYPFICSISSRSSDLSLKQLHSDGEIDLYEIAGYMPLGCAQPFTKGDFKLVYKGTSSRVLLADLRSYVNGGNVPEFELLAIDEGVFADTLVVAQRNLRNIAIFLELNKIRRHALTSKAQLFINTTLVPHFVGEIKDQHKLRVVCDLVTCGVFGYNPTHAGYASAFWMEDTNPAPVGATIRSGLMTQLFGTVLAHECGHCFSLKHEGHHGVDNIMFTVEEDADLDLVTLNMFLEYILLGGEPRFTLDDGRNAWQWIFKKAPECSIDTSVVKLVDTLNKPRRAEIAER